MFANCISLTEVVCLLDTNDYLTNGSTQGWFKYLDTEGKFYKNPNSDDWAIGDDGITAKWEIIDYTE